MTDGLQVTVRPGDRLRFEVQVTPRASRTKLLGLHDGGLKVALEAAPVEGAANAALVRFWAKALGVPRGEVEVVRGLKSRRKTLEVPAHCEAALRELSGR